MNSRFLKKNVIWVWLIGIIILIGLLIYISFYFKSRSDLYTIPLIILSGSVGGVAHAMFYHDNKLIYPKKGNDEQDTWFTLGFFSDIFLGAVAGLVGTLPLDKAATIQIVYVAIISGFGGGAFLKNKAANNSDNQTSTDSDTSILYVPPIKELSKGTSLSLNASIKLGNIEKDVTKEVNWSSSNDTIVSVENGLITALENGESTITATIPGNNNLLATCKVKVG
jgi:uncharacterized protein YjdB